MITEDEITKIFCMADDFCKIYDKFIKVNGLVPGGTGGSLENISGKLVAALSAYCFFPKKPMIAVDRCTSPAPYKQLTLF